mgnify:FL=1
MNNLSNVLKRRRKELGLTLLQVAEAMGVSEATVQRWESGSIKSVRYDKIDKLAKVLKVEPAEIMGWNTSRQEDDKLNKFSADIIDLSNMKRIPILGRIRAGMPIYAAENIEGYTLTDLNGGAEYFGLRVTGDSMNAARIHEGDIVIVRRQDIVENGQIAVVLIDGQDATLKRFNRDGDIVTLMPQSTNPKNKALTYNLKKSSVKILGLVVRVEFEPM